MGELDEREEFIRERVREGYHLSKATTLWEDEQCRLGNTPKVSTEQVQLKKAEFIRQQLLSGKSVADAEKAWHQYTKPTLPDQALTADAELRNQAIQNLVQHKKKTHAGKVKIFTSEIKIEIEKLRKQQANIQPVLHQLKSHVKNLINQNISFSKHVRVFLPKILTYLFGVLIANLLLYLAFKVSIFNSIPLSLLLFIVSIFVFVILSRKVNYELNLNNKEVEKAVFEVLDAYDEEMKANVQAKRIAEKESDIWKKSLIEKSSGFPSFLEFIAIYDKRKDENLENYLETKKNPAIKSAEIVRQEAARRRNAEFEFRKTKAIIDYYEIIAPFLTDFKNDIEVIDDVEKYRDYDDEELADPVTNYLTKEEYRKLSITERNQRALDNYWKRPKSKWHIGKMYERYVGHLYEILGYDVTFQGIFKGYEDLGRDLICKKGNEIIIVQCKNWSQFRTIYEKHIFQFFGTVFQYKDEFPTSKVTAFFYTSTRVSDLARRFASNLNINLKENFPLDKDYPCIKCNVSKPDNAKIYHLPFDQQYDKTKIKLGSLECYCKTVSQAEKAGFRRAYRYKGLY